MKLFNGSKKPAKPPVEKRGWLGFFGFGKKKKYDINVENALSISDVLTCVRVLAESMAALPFDIYKRTPSGGEKDKDHTLQEIVRWQPNPEMTSYDLRLWLWIDALIRGNGAAQIIRNQDDEILQLWPLFSNKLKAQRKETGEREVFYTYKIDKDNEAKLRFEDVFILKLFSSGHLLSPSLIDSGSNLFSNAHGAEEYAREFWENGASPTGFIGFPEGVEPLSEDAQKRFQKDWDQKHTGEGNRHKVPVLYSGAKFNPLQLSHKETQMLESRKYTRSQIAGLFRVPAHLINDLENATYSNIEHQDLGFVKHSLRPLMTNFEQRCRMSLLNDEEKKTHYFKHNVNDLVRGDIKTRFETYAIAIQNGMFNPNNALQKEDESTYEGGDTHFVNGNMIPVDFAKTRNEGLPPAA